MRGRQQLGFGFGQMAIRLNGSLRFYYTYVTNGNTANSTGKSSAVTSQTYIRLYPGFDAVAANGLK